jgi:uncharacterized protein (TIGR00369 family)
MRDGFRPLSVSRGFIDHNGPYGWREVADGRLEFGFQSDHRHVNPNGVLHGGAVIGFLDTVLGHAVVHATGRRCATVSLDTRFIAAGQPGQWITGRVEIRKLTRSMAFVDGDALAGNTLLVAASAIFRIFDAPV